MFTHDFEYTELPHNVIMRCHRAYIHTESTLQMTIHDCAYLYVYILRHYYPLTADHWEIFVGYTFPLSRKIWSYLQVSLNFPWTIHFEFVLRKNKKLVLLKLKRFANFKVSSIDSVLVTVRGSERLHSSCPH